MSEAETTEHLARMEEIMTPRDFESYLIERGIKPRTVEDALAHAELYRENRYVDLRWPEDLLLLADEVERLLLASALKDEDYE